MTGLVTEITNVKEILFHGVATNNMKQWRLTDIEEFFHKKMPAFKKAFNVEKFSPIMFGKMTRLIVKAYISPVVYVHQRNLILELLVLSKSKGK